MDFELITTTLLLDGGAFGGLSQLVATGSEQLTLAQQITLFGIGNHTLEVRAADRFLTDQTDFVSTSIEFEVVSEVVPEPGTATLLLLGLLSLGWRSGRRRGRGEMMRPAHERPTETGKKTASSRPKPIDKSS